MARAKLEDSLVKNIQNAKRYLESSGTSITEFLCEKTAINRLVFQQEHSITDWALNIFS